MRSLGTRFLTLAAVVGLAALTLAATAAPALAQGRITGVVRDARGVALSGVNVTVTNQSTSAVSRASTGADGRYTVSGLAAGLYTVQAALVGMEPAVRRGVQVGAGDVALDLVLQAAPLLLEQITVTAMLREQDVSDVPFSITAPTARVMRARGVDNVEALAANVAGFTVQNLGPGQSQPAMRGASSGQIARDQPGVKEQVSTYLDDAVVSLSLYTPDLDLFDVGRVEVLRGPQGTLFGSGSLAGTVRYISNQPQLGARSWFGELGGSIIDGGSPGGIAKLGVNAPLGDRSAARIVGYATRMGGWMDAVQPGGVNVDNNVNGGVRAGGRAALRVDASEKVTVTPRVMYQRVKMDGWNRIDAYNILANPWTTTRPAVTLGERQLFLQIDEPYTDDFVMGDLNLTADLGNVTLTSVSAYTWRDILVVRDAGALTSSITGGSIGLPESVYALNAPLNDATNANSFTQEIRLAGGTSKVQWLFGGFFATNQRDYGQSLIVAGFEDRARQVGANIPTRGLRAQKDELFYSDLSYDLRQVAAFGEATFALTDRLNFTAGLRFYDFEEDREQVFDGIFGNDDNGTALVRNVDTTTANGFAPRFMLSLKASEMVTLNAQASRGFRLGGINDPLNVPLCTAADLATYSGQDSWKDETVWNYEVGAKTRMADGRATLNLSAFYMDIRDLQVVVTAGSCSSRLVLGAPKARSQGLEFEFTAAPSDRVELSASASFTDSELRSGLVSVTGSPIAIPGIVAGNRLPSVPRFQGTAGITYRWPMSQGATGFVTGTWSHIGSRFTQMDDHATGLGTVNLPAFGNTTPGAPYRSGAPSTFRFDPELPAYNLANLRIGMIRGVWEVAVYGNNLTDERAFLALDRERGTRARVGYLTNQPRTVGVSAAFTY